MGATAQDPCSDDDRRPSRRHFSEQLRPTTFEASVSDFVRYAFLAVGGFLVGYAVFTARIHNDYELAKIYVQAGAAFMVCAALWREEDKR